MDAEEIFKLLGSGRNGGGMGALLPLLQRMRGEGGGHAEAGKEEVFSPPEQAEDLTPDRGPFADWKGEG